MEVLAGRITTLRDAPLQGSHDAEDSVALVTCAGSGAEVVYHGGHRQEGVSAELFIVDQRLVRGKKEYSLS